jgi:hypothetical protein
MVREASGKISDTQVNAKVFLRHFNFAAGSF